MPVQVLFDSDSQRSYVTKRVCQNLRLSPIHQERLRLNTLGDTHFKSRHCNVVKFCLQKLGSMEETEIVDFSFPFILLFVAKIEQYTHLTDLKLADCPSEPIDSDTYVHIFIGILLQVRSAEE